MTSLIVISPQYLKRFHARLQTRLPLWVVYRPENLDCPGQWMARMRIISPKPKMTRFIILHDSLNELRAMLPGLERLKRNRDDLPVIEEIWL